MPEREYHVLRYSRNRGNRNTSGLREFAISTPLGQSCRNGNTYVLRQVKVAGTGIPMFCETSATAALGQRDLLREPNLTLRNPGLGACSKPWSKSSQIDDLEPLLARWSSEANSLYNPLKTKENKQKNKKTIILFIFSL